MKKVLLAVPVVALLISCGNYDARLDKMQQQIDSLKTLIASLNGTYSKAIESEAPVSGQKSEDVAKRALDASKDQAIKQGMTEDEVVAVLGQPSRRDRRTDGSPMLYYGTEDCNVEIAFYKDSRLDKYVVFVISDRTHGAFDEAW